MAFVPSVAPEMKAVIRSLGIEPGGIRRIVVEFAFDRPATVYVQRLLSRDEASRFAEVIENVADKPRIVECDQLAVDEDGRINARESRTPLEPPPTAAPPDGV